MINSVDKEESVAFEEKWHNQIVRPKGLHYKCLPIKNYRVTAALYKYEVGDITVFGIMAEDYNPKTNGHFFTIRMGPEELEKCLNDFAILDPNVSGCKTNNVGELDGQ